MLNLRVLRGSAPCDRPFRHLHTPRLLPEAAVAQLLADVPDQGYALEQRHHGSDKTYRVINNVLQPLGAAALSLPPAWATLLGEFDAPLYRRCLGDKLGVSLDALPIEVTLKCYRPGHFISAHTDRDEVPATQLLFFNTTWRNDWGGLLCLLGEGGVDAAHFCPLAGNALAFRQSSRSWHRVSEVGAAAPTRIVLQIAFWRAVVRAAVPGRLHEALDDDARCAKDIHVAG